MKNRGLRAKIASLIGLTAVVIGAMLAAPTAAPASLGGYFEIVNPVYGGCLDVTNASTAPGTRIQEFHCKNNDAQLWLPEKVNDDPSSPLIKLRNRGSGLCLHVAAGVNLTRVDQQDCHNEPGQQWFWRTADVSGHLVLNSAFSNMCLSLVTGTSADGTPIMIANCATLPTQFFRIDN